MQESGDWDSGRVTPADARAALDAVERARGQVAEEVGLPQWYWWLLAGAWLGLGVVGDFGPQWLTIAATVAFGVSHSAIASRLLSGRQRTNRLQVSEETAGHRLPMVVIAMLVALVAVTIAAGFALNADGARHAGIAAAAFVAAIVGFGGPTILRLARRCVHA